MALIGLGSLVAMIILYQAAVRYHNPSNFNTSYTGSQFTALFHMAPSSQYEIARTSPGFWFVVAFVGMIVFAGLVTVSAVISRRFVPAFIVLGYIASWMMWVPGNERRVLFFYHALGMLLFTALALAYALTAIRRLRVRIGDRQVSLAPVSYAVDRQRACRVHLLLPDVDGHAGELCGPTDEGLGRRRVTAFLVVLDAALTLAAGAALAGLVRTHLTFAERALIGVTSGLLVGAAATYGLSLLMGLDTAAVLLGPALTLAAALAVSLLTVNPQATWHASWVESRDRWSQRIPWFSIFAVAGGTAIVVAIFAHTVYADAGGLEAGYPTVWADWSQHLTTASSFAVGGNVPPVNPLLSGTTLLYPFLPDFHAATLMTLGLAPGLALAIPGGVLMVVIGLLVVALGRRLGTRHRSRGDRTPHLLHRWRPGIHRRVLRRVHEPRVHRDAVHAAVRRDPSRHRRIHRGMDAARSARHGRRATPGV